MMKKYEKSMKQFNKLEFCKGKCYKNLKVLALKENQEQFHIMTEMKEIQFPIRNLLECLTIPTIVQ